MASSAPRYLALLVALGATLAVAGCGTPTETDYRSPGGSGHGPGTPRGGEDLPGLYSGYNATTTPHWRHLRTQMSDYRIQYLPDEAARRAEYAWSARHFDRVILDWGDTRSVAEYRRVTPTAELYRYVLTWTVPQPDAARVDPAATYYAHMQQWYSRHPEHQLETAFLHDASRCGSTTKSQACRLTVHIWSSNRWVLNPGDAGLRAYNRERLAGIAADVDGLFVDEHASGDMVDRLKPQSILEYPAWGAYERDVVQLLRDVRTAVGPGKRLLINSYTYVTPWDVEMSAAAGGSHAEAFNNPIFPEMEGRWRHVDALLAAGASMNMLPYDGAMPAAYTAGGFATPVARRRIWELASYYLVAPTRPGLLFFNGIGDKWADPYANSWVPAVEADIGAPLGERRVTAEGTDGRGRRYRVWGRDYERALVLVRPVIEWGVTAYGDETLVDVALPAGERFRPLEADGRVGAAVERASLRAGEAAILVKESRVRIE